MATPYILLIAIHLVLSCIFGKQHAQQTAQPNIIFILADDLGWDDIGYRTTQIKTPNIDFIYNNGVVLENYYVQATCSPSRATLLTGRYPIHHGVIDVINLSQPVGLPLNETTMPQVFAENGYRTHAVGKWHVGMYKWEFTPTFRGFSSFYGYYQGSEDYYTHIIGGYYDLHEDIGINCSIKNNCSRIVTEAKGIYSAFLFTKKAVDLIKNHTIYYPNQALFLYLPYQNVHEPAEVPQSYVNPYNNSIANEKRRNFAGMVSCLDEAIGNITNALQYYGLMNNSIIVFSTDNGGPVGNGYGCGGAVGQANTPFRGGKCSIWEGGTHGNGAIWIPPSILNQNNLKIKKEYFGLMHISDWMPTLLYASNISTQQYNIKFDGINQWNNFFVNSESRFDETVERQNIYYGTNNGCGSNWIINNTGIRVGEMKFLNVSGGHPFGWYPPPNETSTNDTVEYILPRKYWYQDVIGQLFNLTEDIGEHNNIAANNTELVQQLIGMLEQIQEVSNVAPNDENCTNVTHPVYPVVGPVWLPWC